MSEKRKKKFPNLWGSNQPGSTKVYKTGSGEPSFQLLIKKSALSVEVLDELS